MLIVVVEVGHPGKKGLMLMRVLKLAPRSMESQKMCCSALLISVVFTLAFALPHLLPLLQLRATMQRGSCAQSCRTSQKRNEEPQVLPMGTNNSRTNTLAMP